MTNKVRLFEKDMDNTERILTGCVLTIMLGIMGVFIWELLTFYPLDWLLIAKMFLVSLGLLSFMWFAGFVIDVSIHAHDYLRR